MTETAQPHTDATADEIADIDLKDPELSKAALKIQGKFRLKNKMTAQRGPSPATPASRDNIDNESPTNGATTSASLDASSATDSQQSETEVARQTSGAATVSAAGIDEDVAAINLQDPELEKVALKMQSTFRKKK